MERVEGQSTALTDGVVAAEVGDEAVGELVEDDRENPSDDDCPGDGIVQRDGEHEGRVMERTES